MNPLLPTSRSSTGIASTVDSSSPPSRMRRVFRRFSGLTAAATGSPWAFVVASASVVVWALLGPHFSYSDTWQLVINTATSIVTFLMVFLIQNTQNRDARAIHLKLDELIRGHDGARNKLLDLENCTDEEIAKYEEEFRQLRNRSAAKREAALRVGQPS